MINLSGCTSLLSDGNEDLGCSQDMSVDGGLTLDDFFHSSVFKSDFSVDPIRAVWSSDSYRRPSKPSQPRRAAGSQKRERKEGTLRVNGGAGASGVSSAESSSAVDEEVANLVQKINNAASRNAQKAAAAAAAGKAPNIPVSTSSSFSMTSATETGADGLLNKCCRCTPAATTPDGATFAADSVGATAADNAPTSTTAEPAARTTILMNTRLNDFKVNELKLECKKRQLAVSGSKYQIMERLRPYEDAIVAEMEAMRAKYTAETPHYGSTAEPARLDLSVIDAVAANTVGSDEILSARGNEKVGALSSLYRESGENTVRDIINDYLQQQQQFNNKTNNKLARKQSAITAPTTELDYGSGAGCGCVDEPTVEKTTVADAPMMRNNAATFSFAQMGSGGHFTLDESINKNENNTDNIKPAAQRQKQRPVQVKKRKDNSLGDLSKRPYDSELYSKVSESVHDNKRPRQYQSISKENDCLKNEKGSEDTVGDAASRSQGNLRELLSHESSFSMSLQSQKMVDGSASFSSCRPIPLHPPIAGRNGNENELLIGCCDARGCFLSGVTQNNDEHSPRPIQFDPSDPRSIANTLSNHEQMLSYQQKKIHELQRELAYSQQNLRHQQQMILMVKKTQSQRRDGEGRPQAQADFWLCQLDAKTLRNNFSHAVIQHRAQQQQLQMQVTDHEQLVATEQRLQEQIHIDQCVEDIVRLIRQDPRTALLIVQLLRKYQLEHNETKLTNDTHHHPSNKSRGHSEHSRRGRTEIDSNFTPVPIDATQAAACARCCHNSDSVKLPAPIVTLDDEDGSGAADIINTNSNQNNVDKFSAKNPAKKRKRPAAAQPRYASLGTVKTSSTDAAQTEERKKAKPTINSEGNCIDMEEIFRSVLRDPTRRNTVNEPSSPDSTNVNVPAQKSHNFGARATAYAIEKHDATFASGQPHKIDGRVGENSCGHEQEAFSLDINTVSSFGNPSARYQDVPMMSHALNNFVSANIRTQFTRCNDAVSTCPSDAYRCNHPKLNEFGKSSLSIEYSKNHAFDDLMDVLRDDQEKTSMGITECDTMADFTLGYTSDELVNFLADENADNFHANVQHTFRDVNIENARFNAYQTHHVSNGEKSSFDQTCMEICPQKAAADIGFATANGIDKQQQYQLRNPVPLCCYDVEPDATSNSRDAFSSASSALSYSSIGGSNAPSDYTMTDFNGTDDNQLFTPINKSALINAVMQTPNPHQEVDWLDNIDSIFDPEQSLFYGNHPLRPFADTPFK